MSSPYLKCPLFTDEPWHAVYCPFEKECYDKVCKTKWSDLTVDQQKSILSFFRVEDAVPKISILETELVYSEDEDE